VHCMMCCPTVITRAHSQPSACCSRVILSVPPLIWYHQCASKLAAKQLLISVPASHTHWLLSSDAVSSVCRCCSSGFVLIMTQATQGPPRGPGLTAAAGGGGAAAAGAAAT
jgi:hypothetical protein